MKTIAHYHLPGLFEFYELYKIFLPFYRAHGDWFYDWADISSIYGAPSDCLWGGGRTGFFPSDSNSGTEMRTREVKNLIEEYGISARLTFSNSLLKPEHLGDKKCNSLCKLFSSDRIKNGVIVHSSLLADYLKTNFPKLYLVSSTTKVLTDFADFRNELENPDFEFVVPDFRLNKTFGQLKTLPQNLKDKTEFLCNECCDIGCKARKACYENVSRKNLGEEVLDHKCASKDAQGGYRFSKAMKNPAFIGTSDILNTYLPMGFSNFKIEGRGLGSAVVLEFLLYYLTKPEHQLEVREAIYLDSMLDLF